MRPYLLALSFFMFQGCGFRGTAAGNPGTDQSNAISIGASNRIFSGLCAVIHRCHSPVTQDSCWQGIQNSTSFSSPLGLSISPPPTAQEIINMEAIDAFDSNESVALECIAQLEQLECSAPSVQASFAPTEPNPFSLMPAMLDSICKGTFQ